MTFQARIAAVSPAASLWRTHLATLAAAMALVLLLFRRDAADMVAIWWNSSTFNHCLLVLPIIGWLIHQRLPELRAMAPVAWLGGAALAALGAAAWLLGEAGGLALARHFGLVVMLQGLVLGLVGPQVGRAIAFPLAYALFLVPAGEELVPPFQILTAQMTAFLLQLSGVPAHLEGIFITTPGGYFEVAEACAGVKFLIAMAALAALVANVCFRSPRRRFAFVAMALVVPVLANALRAWGTIFVAHHVDIGFAAGFDHVVYGGIFFALVIAATLGLGWPFFDRHPLDPWTSDRSGPRRVGRAPLAAVAPVLLLIAAAPLLWSGLTAAAGTVEPPHRWDPPRPAGWTLVAPSGDWRPVYPGADRVHIARYRDAAGETVDLALIVYARQAEGRELVAFGQGPAGEGNDWTWARSLPAPPGGSAERIVSRALARDVISFYRVGDVITGSGARVKLETMKVRLLGGPQRAVAVHLSARAGSGPAGALPLLRAFLADLGPVDRLADQAAGL